MQCVVYLLFYLLGLSYPRKINNIQEFSGDIRNSFGDVVHTSQDIYLGEDETLGVYTETSNLALPLQFMIKDYGSIQHWQVPSLKFPYSNYALKTLCPQQNGRIQIIVSSKHRTMSSYKISLWKLKYEISTDDVLNNILVSPSSPAIFR